MGKYQATDHRVAVITGTTGGITGGDIIPNGMVGVIKHIAYSEMTNTGQNVLLRTQPSGIELDGRRLAAQENWPDLGWSEEVVVGNIGSSNVLQVVTSQANIVARVTYVVQEGRV
jgi:hypothetical protein